MKFDRQIVAIALVSGRPSSTPTTTACEVRGWLRFESEARYLPIPASQESFPFPETAPEAPPVQAEGQPTPEKQWPAEPKD